MCPWTSQTQTEMLAFPTDGDDGSKTVCGGGSPLGHPVTERMRPRRAHEGSCADHVHTHGDAHAGDPSGGWSYKPFVWADDHPWPCPWVLAGTGLSGRRLTHGPALFDTQSSAVALTCPSRSKNLTQEVFLTLAASLDRSPDPPQLGPIRNRRDPGHGGPSCLASDGRQ